MFSSRSRSSQLTVSGSSVSDSGSGFAACGFVNAGGVGLNVSGGSGSYTYLWEQVGSPATNGPYGINNSATANPIWSDTVCDGDSVAVESWRVTVTDTDTGDTGQLQITVTLIWADLR